MSIIATAAAVSVFAPGAASAHRGSTVVRHVCHRPARVYDTPGGIVIAFLAVREPVRVVMRAAHHRHWLFIRATLGISGWVSDRGLCQ